MSNLCWEHYTTCGYLPNFNDDYELDEDGIKHSVHDKPRHCLYSGNDLDWAAECPYMKGKKEKQDE